ncbi:methyltransferase domain-containing protein [Chitinibacter fontanus]|uniref:Methyltransferase domain-containing protein n=1 Tax=Chitinibacter fontanus TaxID=1737446 RepID=A0A7D5ZGA4_9NEIS|nr:class I SAM-dependent methyltransferase [Chitinibacter fontanus]QLI80130.1 methyltransferase domain-containing protein [Chitinibacter fontanus]
MGWNKENLGPETRKAFARRKHEGFFEKFFGSIVLDVGYRGYEEIDVVPVLPDAIGIDLNYPGYDGKVLPFLDESVDTVYTSHTLEHIDDPIAAIRDWFRVLKVGGYLVITVPHQFLYEKKQELPSRWNLDHKRFYTPRSLIGEVESALLVNSYRIVHLVEDDEFYDYTIPPELHAGGAYQIEMVIKKIDQPSWGLVANGDGRVGREEVATAFKEIVQELAGVSILIGDAGSKVDQLKMELSDFVDGVD